MAKLRKGQEWAILKSPNNSKFHDKIVKVSKKKDFWKTKVAFTKRWVRIHSRTGETDVAKVNGRVEEVPIFRFNKIETTT